MIKLLKDSWTLTTNNLIIAYPLIFFFWIITMMIPAMKNVHIGSAHFVLISLNIIGLILAFVSGWFSMFAKVARKYRKDPKAVEKKEYSFVLLKEFLPGVGRVFVPFLLTSLLYFLLFAGMFAAVGFIGMKFIGIPSLTPSNLMSILSDNQALYNFVHSLSPGDKIKYMKWNFLTFLFGNIFSMITMLWIPILVACSLNPIKSFWLNLKLIMKRPFRVILIYLIYAGGNILLSLLSSVSGNNFLLQLVTMTMMFLFMLYFIMLLFVFVEVNNESSCDCRFDSIG